MVNVKTNSFAYYLNLLGMLVLILILIDAFVLQFFFYQLPCPLCLLQRFGLLCVTFGLFLNLRFGLKSSHYAIILFSALFTAIVALRQIALHAIPEMAPYGNAVWGLHLYTWSLLIAMSVILGLAILLSFDRQYPFSPPNKGILFAFIRFIMVVIVLIVAINVVSIFLQCGFKRCPDTPTKYEMLMSYHFY